MRFTPKKEEEVGFQVLPKGIYPFQVTGAEDKTSSSGNEMIELKVHIRSKSGQTSVVRDYLLEKMAYKLRHFCYGTELGQTYENGLIEARFCLGQQGYAEVGVETYVHQGREGEKNIIEDYIRKEDWQKQQPAEPTQPEEDDLSF